MAQQWRDKAQPRRVDVLVRWQPEMVQQQVKRALVVVAGMVGISLLLGLLQHLPRRRQKQLEARHQAEVGATGGGLPRWWGKG